MDYANSPLSARRIAGIAFVALLHVAIIYALLSGLGVRAVPVLHQPLEAKIIQDVKPPPPAPPPPPPQLVQPPPPYIPPPLVQIAQPPPVPVIAAATAVKPVAPPPKPVPPPQPVRAAARLDPNQSCAAPQYPDSAYDMGETGTSVLQFLISANGSVEQSRIASSSGHAVLDDAALAALAQCHFEPAIGADGQPQQSWATIPFVWQLN